MITTLLSNVLDIRDYTDEQILREVCHRTGCARLLESSKLTIGLGKRDKCRRFNWLQYHLFDVDTMNSLSLTHTLAVVSVGIYDRVHLVYKCTLVTQGASSFVSPWATCVSVPYTRLMASSITIALSVSNVTKAYFMFVEIVT